MMGTSTYPSYGTTLYGMVDALNWEETGHSTLNAFYAIQWWNNASQTTLNQDVVFDTASNGVPIVAEVDASYLPNWTNAGRGLNHFIHHHRLRQQRRHLLLHGHVRTYHHLQPGIQWHGWSGSQRLPVYDVDSDYGYPREYEHLRSLRRRWLGLVVAPPFRLEHVAPRLHDV